MAANAGGGGLGALAFLQICCIDGHVEEKAYAGLRDQIVQKDVGVQMIPAREAIILWDGDLKKVVVKRVGEPETSDQRKLTSSGGAAYAAWQEASPDELYFRLMQKFASLVRDDRIPVEVVHNAFLEIPEYVATLPPCEEQDELENSGVPVELPTTFGSGYP